MRPAKFKEVARMNLNLEADDKRRAIQRLEGTDFTLSEYLQNCVRELAAGRVMLRRAESPESPADNLTKK